MGPRFSFSLAIVTSAVIAVVLLFSLWAVGLVKAGPGLLPSLQGGAPTVINYQGRLTDPSTGQAKTDGTYNMVFRIYDTEAGGIPLWTGTHTAANGNPVMVSGGIFSVLLGSGPGNSLSASLFSGADRWIEIQINSEILTPRQRVGSVPYALQAEEAKNAATVGGLAPWAFVGQGQASSVTSAMLAAGAVSSNALASGSVGTNALADGSVTSAKIADGTIVNADISPNAAISPTKIVLYGDGSAGPLNVTSSTTLAGSTNFTDCNINSGATLQVGAGTIIRCTGVFTNNGTILVLRSTPAGLIAAPPFTTAQVLPFFTIAGVGDAGSPAGLPAIVTNVITVAGGGGGAPMPALETSAWHQIVRGGGGGIEEVGIPESARGGGLLRVMTRGSILNAGLIQAQGGDADPNRGGGGGGGGMVILASSTAVTNTGQIDVEGGDGGNSNNAVGPGGGGGGGLITLIAPAVSNPGATIFGGGAAGAIVGNVTADVRRGGGGGGGSAAPGGAGGAVPPGANVTPLPAVRGEDGRVTILLADPMTMGR